MSDHDGNALADMVDGDLGLEEERVGLTAAGIQAAGQGAAPEPAPRFRIIALAGTGSTVVLKALDQSGREMLRALRLRAHVEVRPVGEANGEPGSATRAGIESGWGSARSASRDLGLCADCGGRGYYADGEACACVRTP